MTEVQAVPATGPAEAATARTSWKSRVASAEIDTRLIGMVIALGVLCLGLIILLFCFFMR
jgi:hypothetical protein